MPSGYLATDNPEGPRRRSIACFEHGYVGVMGNVVDEYIALSVHPVLRFYRRLPTTRNYRIEDVAMVICGSFGTFCWTIDRKL